MANEDFFEDDLNIILSVDGTEYEEVEVKVTDLNKTIRNQISSLLEVFKLPKIDGCGNPIQYLLGRTQEGDEDECLELEDKNGREMTLVDYDVRSGDRLHLISVPIAYACPIPTEMKIAWTQYDMYHK